MQFVKVNREKKKGKNRDIALDQLLVYVVALKMMGIAFLELWLKK